MRNLSRLVSTLSHQLYTVVMKLVAERSALTSMTFFMRLAAI